MPIFTAVATAILTTVGISSTFIDEAEVVEVYQGSPDEGEDQ